MDFSFEIIFNILTNILLAFVSVMLIVLIIKDRNRNKHSKATFFKLLSHNFERNLINSKDDILLLLNPINREYDRNYSIITILEDYIVYITKNEEIDNENIYTKLKEIINRENQENPFNNVPDEEKRILRNINDNIKNKYFETLEKDMQELSSIITTRNKMYEKANKINKWSLPIAVIGIIIAIIFGILGFKNIDYDRIESINKNLIENQISK